MERVRNNPNRKAKVVAPCSRDYGHSILPDILGPSMATKTNAYRKRKSYQQQAENVPVEVADLEN